MRRFFVATALLLITTPRLPAPVQEIATPTPEATARHKSEAGERGSASQFNGTWRYTNNDGSYTLTIRDGHTAEWASEFTAHLGNQKAWPPSVLPSSYSTVPEVSAKIIGKTNEVKIEGSHLTITWSPGSKKIIEWSPKSLPYEALANSSRFRMKLGTELYTLNGNILVRTNHNGSTSPFVRIK